MQAYNRQHLEEKRAYMHEYYQQHIDEYNAYYRECYQQHAEERKAYHAEYDRSDAGKAVHRAEGHNRRIAGGEPITAEIWMEVVEASNGVCPYCEGPIVGLGHMDHVVPLSKGGTNERSNLKYVCASCNRAKGGKDLEVFLASI